MSTLTLQPDAAAGIDTYIRSDIPTTNYGTFVGMMIGSGTSDPAQQAPLVRFDLSGLPAGAIIDAATLYMTLYNFSLAGTFVISRILSGNSGWTETGATWNKQDGTNDWAGGAGCMVSGTDFSASPLYSGDPGTDVGEQSFSLDLAEFAAMVASNNGMVIWCSTITGGGGTNPYRWWRPSDHTTASERPKLVVEYYIPVAGEATLLPPIPHVGVAGISPLLGGVDVVPPIPNLTAAAEWDRSRRSYTNFGEAGRDRRNLFEGRANGKHF